MFVMFRMRKTLRYAYLKLMLSMTTFMYLQLIQLNKLENNNFSMERKAIRSKLWHFHPVQRKQLSANQTTSFMFTGLEKNGGRKRLSATSSYKQFVNYLFCVNLKKVHFCFVVKVTYFKFNVLILAVVFPKFFIFLLV